MYIPSFKIITLAGRTDTDGDESQALPTHPPMLKDSEKKSSGQFTRYFIKHVVDNILYEVSEKTYSELVLRTSLYDYRVYRLVELNWDASNPKLDQRYGKYIQEGSNTKNLKQVRLLEDRMPGLEYYLKEAGELL